MEKQAVGLTLAQWIKAKGGSFRTNITSEVVSIVCGLGDVELVYSGMFDLKAMRTLEQVFESLSGMNTVPTSTSEVGITARWIREQYKVSLCDGLQILDSIVKKQRDIADADGFLPVKGNGREITFSAYLDGEQGDFIMAEGAKLDKIIKFLTVDGAEFEVVQGGVRLGKNTVGDNIDSFKNLVLDWNERPYEAGVVKRVSEVRVAEDNIDSALEVLRDFLSCDMNTLTGSERKRLYWGGGEEVSKNKRGTFASNFPADRKMSMREFVERTVENGRRTWGLDNVVKVHKSNAYAFVVGMILRAKGQFVVEGDDVTFKPVFNNSKTY